LIPRFRPDIGRAELAALLRSHAGAVERFEAAFAHAFGAAEAVAFPYGRSALWAFLEALDLRDGAVVMPAYTCSVVAHAVSLSSNRPRFVDIRLSDYNMDLDLLEAAIDADTHAVVATHLFGYPLDLERLEAIVARAEARFGHKIWLVQDCAHAFGATLNGRLVGSSGDVALYGLNVSKTMTSIFGGMLTFRDSALAGRVRAWRDAHFRSPGAVKSLARRLYLVAAAVAFLDPVYGVTHWLQHETSLLDRLTRSYHLDNLVHFPADHLDRMTDVEAAVGMEQLRRYPAGIAHRRRNAAHYASALTPRPGVVLPPIVEGATYSHYVVRVPDRSAMVAAMARRGIELGELIQYSIPELDAYRGVGPAMPLSAQASRTTVNLPVDPSIDDARRARVVAAFNEASDEISGRHG
jgi:dTDP-4-amino-4,6-dideoxygalactose transaminase